MRQLTNKNDIIFIPIIVLLIAGSFDQILRMFVQHLSPDMSVYLLGTETVLENHTRFASFHDSKGIGLNVILMPIVYLLGGTVVAAAITQCLFFLGTAVLLYAFFIHGGHGRLHALAGSLFWFCLACGTNVWGGNARPEDFSALIFAFIFYVNTVQRNPLWFFCAGCAMGFVFFIKASLFIYPALLLGITVVLGMRDVLAKNKEPGDYRASLIWHSAGLLFVFFLFLSWILIFDDFHKFIDQSILWPFIYRHDFVQHQLSSGYRLYRTARLQGLFILGVIGLLYATYRKKDRGARQALILLGAEYIRITTEGAIWVYVLVPSLLPLVVGIHYLGGIFQNRRRKNYVILCAMLVGGWYLPSDWFVSAVAVKKRLLDRVKTPFETMSEIMRDGLVKTNEAMMVLSNDFSLNLLVPNSTHYPVLPMHLAFLPSEARDSVAAYYKESPPDWVIASSPSDLVTNCVVTGMVEFPVYYCRMTGIYRCREGDASIRCIEGPLLFYILPRGTVYELRVDIGCLQAWHRVIDGQD